MNVLMAFDPAKHHRRSIRLKGYDYTRAGAYFVTVVTRQRECLFGHITADGEMVLSEFGECVKAFWHDIPGHFPHADIDEYVIMPNHVHGIVVIADALPDRAGGMAATDGAGVGDRGGDAGNRGGETPPLHPGSDEPPPTADGVRRPNDPYMDTGGAGMPVEPVGAGSPRPDPPHPHPKPGPPQPTDPGTGPQPNDTGTTPSARPPTLGQIVAYFKYRSAKCINAQRGLPGAPVWQRNYYEHVVRNEASLDRIREYIAGNPLHWTTDRENPQQASP